MTAPDETTHSIPFEAVPDAGAGSDYRGLGWRGSIAAYSQVAAHFGYGLARTAVFSYPLMATIREVSARIGGLPASDHGGVHAAGAAAAGDVTG